MAERGGTEDRYVRNPKAKAKGLEKGLAQRKFLTSGPDRQATALSGSSDTGYKSGVDAP
jgi:hypothetical protein